MYKLNRKKVEEKRGDANRSPLKRQTTKSDNEFLTKGQREELSRELLIHPGRIKVWYQNRRAKKRREDQLRERIEAAARTGSTVVAD